MSSKIFEIFRFGQLKAQYHNLGFIINMEDNAMISHNKNRSIRVLSLVIIVLSFGGIQYGCSTVSEDDATSNHMIMNPMKQELESKDAASTPIITAVPVPSGFKLILTGTGVSVYRKDYTGGQPDFVTVVDLRKGSLINLTGVVKDVPNDPNDKIWRKRLGTSLGTFWSDAKAKNTSTRTAKVVVNGTFFSHKEDPTPIAFGLKVSGKVISYGYGLNEFPGLNRTLSIDAATAKVMIDPYNKATFDGSMPDVVGALDPAANKDASRWIQRTFVGVRDDDNNGIVETVMFYSSKLATQVWASNILTSFGASKIAMLDGGGSTGLIIDGISYITPGRTIPHAIAIYSGK
jgi:hypothetical protein